ncbi:hypothetical protein [Streptomyces candidus]|uniref:MFS family permease n=1 Tax=Streptomyces candidus TaxID=67283 RepID=A0A7X0HB74_9ACTN|nr:hypothetical protein [Streptomyces candidus]MBB6434432.1 MFS family permease [Streptomyces candidus]
MGVRSAVAGLSTAAVPARIGLHTRWRIATAALVVLSVPLLFAGSPWQLYAVVFVVGIALAPHMITILGRTERVLPATRLAASMAFLMSGTVAGQAPALAVSGRLAATSGPPAAFAVAVGAALLCAALSWTVGSRPAPGRTAAGERGARRQAGR